MNGRGSNGPLRRLRSERPAPNGRLRAVPERTRTGAAIRDRFVFGVSGVAFGIGNGRRLRRGGGEP